MRSLHALAAPAVLLAGCSANVATSADIADAESSPAAAVIVVERTTGDSPHAEAVARFVRARSGPLDSEALRWVGLEPELPVTGTCAHASGDVATMPAGGLRLLDVGRVTLTAELDPLHEPQAIDLGRRRVPDVVDVVSGVFYTASGFDVPTAGNFEVDALGEPELAGVHAQADFAGEPTSIRVQGIEASSSPSSLMVALDSPIDLTWDAARGTLDSAQRELLYVDISATDPATHKASITRCAAADTGHFILPPAAFGDADGSISVHRMHRSTFHTTGIDRGELRLDFAHEMAFAVRAHR